VGLTYKTAGSEAAQQIAAQHALSDIYAMGGVAKTTQVGLTL